MGGRMRHGSATTQELAEQFGVSTSTLDRVKTILEEGSPEQIQALREKGETGKWASTKYTSESGAEAASKRWASGNGDEQEDPDDDGIDNDGGNDDITSEIPLASPDADDMRPPSADRGGIGGHKGSATSQELAEQFGVSSSTLERVRRGNKENNGSNSGADADDHDITSEIWPASAEASDIPSEFERADSRIE